jgi:hypothetical protein
MDRIVASAVAVIIALAIIIIMSDARALKAVASAIDEKGRPVELKNRMGYK